MLQFLGDSQANLGRQYFVEFFHQLLTVSEKLLASEDASVVSELPRGTPGAAWVGSHVLLDSAGLTLMHC